MPTNQPPSTPRTLKDVTGDDLAVVMRAIRPLDSGALHCRYCPAGSNNQWQHSEHCIYEQSVKDADVAHEIVTRLRIALASASAPQAMRAPTTEPETVADQRDGDHAGGESG
jgi:hypothetical protein